MSFALVLGKTNHGRGGQAPASLPAWLSGVAVNEWVEISGTALSSVEPSPLPGTSPSTPASKITAWCGAALRRANSTYIIGMAGGHGDYAGNEIDALDLSADAPAWAEISARSADADIYNRSAFYADLKGAAYHTYGYLQFVDSQDTLVGFRNPGVDYAGFPNPPYATPGGWAYDNAAGNGDGNYTFSWSPAYQYGVGWRTPTWVPEFPTTAGDWVAALCVKHPTTGDVYIAASGDRWRKWTASTQAWSTPSATTETNYCYGAIDSTRDRMLIVGDFGGTVDPRVRDLTGATVSATFGGLGASTLRMSGYPGVVYDEENDRFLVFKNTDPITVYAVDASTWVVSTLSTTGTTPAQRSNGIHNSVQYVPALKGVVFANAYSGNVKFLRLG